MLCSGRLVGLSLLVLQVPPPAPVADVGRELEAAERAIFPCEAAELSRLADDLARRGDDSAAQQVRAIDQQLSLGLAGDLRRRPAGERPHAVRLRCTREISHTRRQLDYGSGQRQRHRWKKYGLTRQSLTLWPNSRWNGGNAVF